MSHLEAGHVTKTFGGVKALDDVGISLRKGEVHALVGANGAGKSTLARIIAGHLRADHAEISIGGARAEIASPRDAINLGVAMVTQQLSLAGHLSVAENIMLTEMARPGRLNRRRIRDRAAEMLDTVNPAGGIALDAEARLLSPAHRQMVEIAKAMSQNPQVIIFDEPTTSLTPFETERLFEVMEGLTGQDRALVFVSHRLEEIFTICDVVTVLRDGHNICSGTPIGELDQAALIQRIIGREIGNDIYSATSRDSAPAAGGDERPVVLEVRHLLSPPKVADVSFCLRKGEILGLAGLVGAGRSETARAIFGLDRMTGGEILLHGKAYRGRSPRDSYRRRMAMIPEDRKTQGAIPDFTVRENILISHSSAFSRFGTGYSALMPTVLGIIQELRLEPRNLQKFILQLSGGMQQKAMLSRALLVDPGILILDEPTQGVDIGTRTDIYVILRRLAARGLSMIFISSDFKEALGISDRIVVLSEGRSVAEFDAALMDEEKLTMFAAPRTSARGTFRLLEALTSRWPESCAYWMYFSGEMVYCFDMAGGGADFSVGFTAGTVTARADTCLADRSTELVNLIEPRRNARGQSLGHIGLTLPESRVAPGMREEFARLIKEWE